MSCEYCDDSTGPLCRTHWETCDACPACVKEAAVKTRDAEIAKLKACVRAADKMKPFVGGSWSGWEGAKENYDAARAEVEL